MNVTCSDTAMSVAVWICGPLFICRSATIKSDITVEMENSFLYCTTSGKLLFLQLSFLFFCVQEGDESWAGINSCTVKSWECSVMCVSSFSVCLQNC